MTKERLFPDLIDRLIELFFILDVFDSPFEQLEANVHRQLGWMAANNIRLMNDHGRFTAAEQFWLTRLTLITEMMLRNRNLSCRCPILSVNYLCYTSSPQLLFHRFELFLPYHQDSPGHSGNLRESSGQTTTASLEKDNQSASVDRAL